MLKTCKIRLYPNKIQQQTIASQIGGSRYIFNRMLSLRKNAYEKFGKNISKFDLNKHATKLRKRSKTSWLKDVDSQVLQQAIGNMDLAYKNFFRRVKNGEAPGFPKFRSKHHSRQTFQYPQRVKINDDLNKIYLPKVGWVKCKGFRKSFAGQIKTVTVSFEANQYHASVLLKDFQEQILGNNNNGEALGIDVGVKLVVADSNGNKVLPLKLIKELSKLRLRAKQLSNKKKGSKNRYKSKIRLAKINLKIANKRKDFLHKLSKQYSENQTVVVEDLKIKNMTKSAKGTVETPGKMVKQKAGLKRVITQQSWGMFFEMLQYKLARNGGELLKVDPRFTSQTCPKCEHVSKENRLSQAEFKCQKCNYSNNADIVGALNVLARGIHGKNASHQIAS